MATLPTLPAAPAFAKGRKIRSKQTSLTLFPTAACHGGPENACAASMPTPAPTPEPDRSQKPAAELVGIARLAASSLRAEAKRGTEYFLLPVRSIVNHCDSERVPFHWTINPYRGCEFGCRYCYARYTHEYMELDGSEFEKKIYAKKNAGELAARDLLNPKLDGEHIAIGTATDPYQPAEREFEVTRAILERMAEREGMSLSITTKSNQVLRDLDLLKKISERSQISIHMTVTTLRPRLARLLEPRAPRPDLRLEAVKKLHEAGICVGVNAMPILPGLTDREADLDALVKAAHDAGAEWISAGVLFLQPASWKTMITFLDQKFPRLARQYREWYRGYGNAPDEYRKKISALFQSLREKHGIKTRPFKPPEMPGAARRASQMQFDLASAPDAMRAIAKVIPRDASEAKVFIQEAAPCPSNQ
jgi:DNA repair photolyase